jgi:hypothetical protein
MQLGRKGIMGRQKLDRDLLSEHPDLDRYYDVIASVISAR